MQSYLMIPLYDRKTKAQSLEVDRHGRMHFFGWIGGRRRSIVGLVGDGRTGVDTNHMRDEEGRGGRRRIGSSWLISNKLPTAAACWISGKTAQMRAMM